MQKTKTKTLLNRDVGESSSIPTFSSPSLTLSNVDILLVDASIKSFLYKMLTENSSKYTINQQKFH